MTETEQIDRDTKLVMRVLKWLLPDIKAGKYKINEYGELLFKPGTVWRHFDFSDLRPIVKDENITT